MKIGYNDRALKEIRKKLRRDETKVEKLLWEELRGRKLGMKFYRQYSVGHYVLDFYSAKSRVAVELDGGYHEAEEVKMNDEVRTEFLESQGIVVLRFLNNEVFENMESVLEKIKASCVPPLDVRGGEGALVNCEFK